MIFNKEKQMFDYIVLALVAITGVCAFIDYLGKRWSVLPDFITNHVGGSTAICSVADYEKALRKGVIYRGDGPDGKGLVIVRDTIVFTNDPERKGVASGGLRRFSSSDPWKIDCFGFGNAQTRPDLFVPFVSDRYSSQADQVGLFISPQADLDAFEERKVAENGSTSVRRRFGAWYRESQKFGPAYFLSILVTVVCVILWLMANVGTEPMESHVFLNTEEGYVVNHDSTFRPGKEQSLVLGGDPWDFRINKATVMRKQYIGGGLWRVCAGNPEEPLGRRDCMMSAIDVEMGETVYYRLTDFAGYIEGKGYVVPLFGERFLISEEEAQRLLDTGQLTLVE